MMDAFFCDSLSPQASEVDDEAMAHLVDSAEAYLRAGGSIDYEFWRTLRDDSKAAFICANGRIWRERCGMIGQATHSLIDAVSLQNPEAGKDLIARNAINSLMIDMEKKLKP